MTALINILGACVIVFAVWCLAWLGLYTDAVRRAEEEEEQE